MTAFGSCYINTDTWTLTRDTMLGDDGADWDAAMAYASGYGKAPLCDDPFRVDAGFEQYQLVDSAVAREIALATPPREEEVS